MNGIIIIDKPKDYTSRDIVNIVGKVFHTKKVGHTGTLDPLATGVLVVCINKATKLVELLTCLDKEYIAEFEFGTLTDTLDNTGNIVKSENINISEEDLVKTLKDMIGEYEQTVPIYSAVKVNGRKLYEYARNNEEVELPIHKVNLFDLNLIDINYRNGKTYATIKCYVSKGTYIRSLGNDIALRHNTNAIMTNLRRTKQGNFCIDKAITLDKLDENTKLIPISDCLSMYSSALASPNIKEAIKNGRSVPNIYNEEIILFVDELREALALYIMSDDKITMKPWKMFKI